MSLVRAPGRFALLVMLAAALLVGLAIADLSPSPRPNGPSGADGVNPVRSQRKLCCSLPWRQTAASLDAGGVPRTEGVACWGRPVSSVLCRHARRVPRVRLPSLLDRSLASHRQRRRTSGSPGPSRKDGKSVPLPHSRCCPAIVRPRREICDSSYRSSPRVEESGAGGRARPGHHVAGPLWRGFPFWCVFSS